jgi:two-component system, cell cycle response regulator DivK
MMPPIASPARILLVEDNAHNAYLARYLLENAGHAVAVVPTGRSGLEHASAHLPDLILLDIQLPDIDGYEIATRLKGDPRTRDIPLVALSSFAMAGEKQKALALGCSGYIEKPLQAMKFVGQVNAFLPPRRDSK